jgi:basic membrane lipoprotein Med (substrate-binding protein (PBP1-ABC) superfamily)
VVLVTDESGLKDGYYNQLTYNGIEKKQLPNTVFNLVVETAKSASDYDSVLKAAVELTPDLIVISNPTWSRRRSHMLKIMLL